MPRYRELALILLGITGERSRRLSAITVLCEGLDDVTELQLKGRRSATPVYDTRVEVFRFPETSDGSTLVHAIFSRISVTTGGD